jgi:hypothetical protein
MTPHFRRIRIYTNRSLFSSCKKRLAKGKKMTGPGTRFAPAATLTPEFSPAPPTASQNKPAFRLMAVTHCMTGLTDAKQQGLKRDLGIFHHGPARR